MAENKDYKYVDHYDFNEELLKQAFAEARRIYKERGFMRKMGRLSIKNMLPTSSGPIWPRP